jgi:NADPH:quinone reductase-like Zn-dependent oxidoreductase
MKAVISEKYGGPEVLEVEDVPVPRVGPNGILVEVHASSVNPLDWKLRRGMLRPRYKYVFPVIWGSDFSGVVTEVGTAVTFFKPGDEVYGFKAGSVGRTYRGTYAEYAVVPEKVAARKPRNLNHEEAAAVPLAGVTAWQVLVTKGSLKPGNRVLIHAGAGGVGIFAVQIAKALGAYVAATASSRNQEFLRELGADLPINYEMERIEDKISNCDLILDGVGKRVWPASLSVLKRGGTLMTLVAPTPHGNAGKMRFFLYTGSQIAAWTLRAAFAGKSWTLVMVEPRGGDLDEITKLVETGKVRPVVDRVLPLEQIAEAHRLSEGGHVKGKIVIKIR